MIKNFHLSRVFKMWLDLAVLTGELDFPDYSANSKRGIASQDGLHQHSIMLIL